VIELCPCCCAPVAGAGETVRIFDVPYYRCSSCGHAFIRDQPSDEALHSIFAHSEAHSAPYIDHASVEIRQDQIIRPKVEWVLDIFRRLYDGAPKRALDVGAGGGHFVAGLRNAGVAAEGIEISSVSRAFAREAFGIELSAEDFLAARNLEPQFDLLTFWGLLEYAPEPRRFLDTARPLLRNGNGLLVVEVPRFNCLGTAVQAKTPQTVARHLDPTTHVNTFTDSSLATALVETGFHPVAVWYFGMDVYEMLLQMALRMDDPNVLDRLSDFIPVLQASVDQGRQCDNMIFGGDSDVIQFADLDPF
jgi:SAM-dependent methyltransferase